MVLKGGGSIISYNFDVVWEEANTALTYSAMLTRTLWVKIIIHVLISFFIFFLTFYFGEFQTYAKVKREN